MKGGNSANSTIFEYDEYSHGIDYLSFGISSFEVVKDFFTSRTITLDTDNSNFGVIEYSDELLSVRKYKAPTGMAYAFSITYQSIPIPIFEITCYSKNQSEFCSGQWGIVHTYGAFFRLIELDYLSDNFIQKYNSAFLKAPITRLDYRFDFCNFDKVLKLPKIEEVLPNLRSNKRSKEYKKGKRLQSWEVGNKRNKTIFIRLYNKLDELEGNIKKTYLYGDLDKYKTYTRLEYEFGSKYCAGYLGKDIKELIDKGFGTSGLEESSFEGNLYKPQIALDLSNKIQRLRYIKIFTSMAKNLKNNGIDPINLINEIGI